LRLEKLIERAIRKKGFSVVEVCTPCPTTYGRRNRLGAGVDMIRGLGENSVSIEKAAKMPPEELEGKIITGVFVDIDRPEYTQEYAKLQQRLRKNAVGVEG
jgi:2-oxoglutarate ferredoxin oxidoreductase subunit beta